VPPGVDMTARALHTDPLYLYPLYVRPYARPEEAACDLMDAPGTNCAL
jgi:hypothetical protein